MCVIVIKKKGVEIENDELLDMWYSNPDGAGLAYYDDNGDLEILKGFMDVCSLKEALNTLKYKDVVVHFRWATHGLTNEHQTHPFVITKSVKRAKSVDRRKPARAALFHNGVISNYGNKKISDTIEFTTKVIARIPEVETRIDVLKLEGSKYVLMQDGKIYSVGEFEEYGDLICSNVNWLYGRHAYHGMGWDEHDLYKEEAEEAATKEVTVDPDTDWDDDCIRDWSSWEERHDAYMKGTMNCDEADQYEAILMGYIDDPQGFSDLPEEESSDSEYDDLIAESEAEVGGQGFFMDGEIIDPELLGDIDELKYD